MSIRSASQVTAFELFEPCADPASARTPESLFELVKQRGPSYVAAAATVAGAGPGATDTRGRTYHLVELSDDLEVWVIRWPSGGLLELHDHGGSSGAFVVVEGTLVERFVTGGQALGRRHVRTGQGAGFGPTYVHDVTNAATHSSVSVHAYSPPMPGMTFYELSGRGELETTRWEDRSDSAWHP